MAITMPSIDVSFKQLATSIIERSSRGVAILIIRDNTDNSFDIKEYRDIASFGADAPKYTDSNANHIKDTLLFGASKVYVVRIDTTTAKSSKSNLIDALKIIEKNIKTGWITIADATEEDSTALVSWIKSKESEGKTYKAVVYKVATADNKHIVNFYNEKVVFADKRGEVTGDKYLPSLAGLLASCNINKSCTNYHCSNLVNCSPLDNNDTAVGSGKFILINDTDKVLVALGINSLTTVDGGNLTEDMKFIDIVEAMDLIADDIKSTFKNDYLGKFKNNYDNQVLLLSAINGYFKQLALDNILDINYENKADVDVTAQREAFISTGKSEALEWDEQKVKNNAFKRTVFLKADIKILGSMENLKFVISMA